MAGETPCPICTQPCNLCRRSMRSSTQFRIKMLPRVFEYSHVSHFSTICCHIPLISDSLSSMQEVYTWIKRHFSV
jgi:hypothetical protein